MSYICKVASIAVTLKSGFDRWSKKDVNNLERGFHDDIKLF
jgi:hypothetical protein